MGGPSGVCGASTARLYSVGSREERIAKNEAVAREINEGIEASLSEASAEGHVRMLCECSNSGCEELIAISIQEYEQVRRDARTFAVWKGHVTPDVEDVVAETDRYVVVRKREGTPAEVAEATDPRS